MLTTTIVHVCARCGSERIRKNGHADNGAQRAKCLDCERTFILQPKGARYDQKFKDQVVAAYQDRMSIRGITRKLPTLRRLTSQRTRKEDFGAKT